MIESYPIKNIRDIDNVWKQARVTIQGQRLHLDNIEHDIIRPIFRDWRIHAALSVLAYSSGNLQAYHGADVQQKLNFAAETLLRHRRGLQIEGSKITLVKFFDWYSEDFGDNDEIMLQTITPYLSKADKVRLQKISPKSRKIKYVFDWSLNDFIDNK